MAKIIENGKPPLYPRPPTDVDRSLSFNDVVRVVEDPDLGFIDTNRLSEDDQIVIGFMLAPDDDYFFIDWDDVRDPSVGDTSVPESVVEWVNEIGGYTEVSPSGTGLKTICRSNGEMKPVDALSNAGKIYFNNSKIGNSENKPHIDVYTGGQYTTVTGEVFGEPFIGYEHNKLSDGGSTLAEIGTELLSSPTIGSSEATSKPVQKQNSLKDICSLSFSQEKSRQNKTAHMSSQWINGEWIETENPSVEQIITTGCTLDDSFLALWNGDVSGCNTVSEADNSLVSKIWYYAGNRSLVDEVFRRSNLYGIRSRRPGLSNWNKSYPKWDVGSYRRSTIKHARDNDRHQGRYLDPSTDL